MFWQIQGAYEVEVIVDRNGMPAYSGWYRCIGGRLADGRWPEWHTQTGATRYSR